LNSPSTLIAKGITNITPVVFANVTYPVELGVIESLDTSNNNFVGVSNYISFADQFYYFENLFPYTNTLGFIHRMGEPNSELQFTKNKFILNKRNIAVIDIPVIDMDDLHLQLNNVISKVNAFYLACNTFSQDEEIKIVLETAKAHHIPTFSCRQENVIHGSLMSYSYLPSSIGKLAGNKAALLLHGAEPTWLHTESPPDAVLTINSNTANNLGIVVPSKIRQETHYVFNH